MGIQEALGLTVSGSMKKVGNEDLKFPVAFEAIPLGTVVDSTAILAEKGWSSWRPGRSSLWLA
jgi:hypothetical protein